MVGDGNAVRVTSEVLKDVLWAAERPFGVHDPVLSEELSQELPELLRVSQTPQGTVEAEFVCPKQTLQAVDELASEDFAEDADGEKGRRRRTNPVSILERETAGGDDAVKMWMVLQVLSPCMQHREKADLRTEMLRVGSNFYKCLRSGAEQKVVHKLLIL